MLPFALSAHVYQLSLMIQLDAVWMDDTIESILSEGLSWLLLVLLGLVIKWLNPFKCADAKAMPP